MPDCFVNMGLDRFRQLPLADWEIKTFEDGKKYAQEIAATAGV